MSIIPADMFDCDKKQRCIVGPNAGLTYNAAFPCFGNETFNEELCDCELYFECDCSCRNDCPECYLCVNGTCEPDPTCEDLMVKVVETQTVYTGNWMCRVLVADNPSCMGEWVQQSEPASVSTREYILTKQAYDSRQPVGGSGPDSGNACATASRYTSVDANGQTIFWYDSGTAAISNTCPLSEQVISCPADAPGTNFCSTFDPQGSYSVYSTSVSYFTP